VGDSAAICGKLFQDFVGTLLPDEGPWVLVPALDPLLDRHLEFFGRAVRAASQPLVGEFGEPALDHVHPRAVGGREVQVEPRVTEQPAVDLGRLVARDVVDDQVSSRSSGTLRLMRFKNFSNSTARWRSVISAMTFPEAMSSAS